MIDIPKILKIPAVGASIHDIDTTFAFLQHGFAKARIEQYFHRSFSEEQFETLMGLINNYNDEYATYIGRLNTPWKDARGIQETLQCIHAYYTGIFIELYQMVEQAYYQIIVSLLLEYNGKQYYVPSGMYESELV